MAKKSKTSRLEIGGNFNNLTNQTNLKNISPGNRWQVLGVRDNMWTRAANLQMRILNQDQDLNQDKDD